MKLEPPYVIAESKLTNYLLVYLPKDDKSRYLSLAGYGTDNWSVLEKDLLKMVETEDAVFESSSVFGDSFSITGSLVGPNAR